MKFVAFLFYRYYSTGATKYIPYFSTLSALVMLVGLHIFQLILLFYGIDFFKANSRTRTENFLVIAILLIPLFLLMSVFIKESQLKQLKYDKSKIKRGNLLLIVYIFCSIAFLLLLILIRRDEL